MCFSLVILPISQGLVQSMKNNLSFFSFCLKATSLEGFKVNQFIDLNIPKEQRDRNKLDPALKIFGIHFPKKVPSFQFLEEQQLTKQNVIASLANK